MIKEHPYVIALIFFFLMFFEGFVLNQASPAEMLEVLGGFGMFITSVIGIQKFHEESKRGY
jgi:hypothetical protein